MMLIREDPNKGDCEDKFTPITLLNTELKVLGEKLARVADDLIGEA